MSISVVKPNTKENLNTCDSGFIDSAGKIYPIINGAARFAEAINYTDSFGLQWNKFCKTQIDRDGLTMSKNRFFKETRWGNEDLDGKYILEVGSGAGRFSRIILEFTQAVLYSVDFSDAVSANFKNNSGIAPDRFKLFQASVYEMPFPDNSFDKVVCLGVLQHTPDFEGSIKALIDKAKPGGEIVVDFYPINGWWTKLNSKYLLRPITKRMNHAYLLGVIEKNIYWLIKSERFLHKIGLGILARFLPIVDIQGTFPKNLTESEITELAVLDTFDMFSPEFDNPQRVKDVVSMFTRHGAEVTFAGYECFEGGKAAVVRGVKVDGGTH